MDGLMLYDLILIDVSAKKNLYLNIDEIKRSKCSLMNITIKFHAGIDANNKGLVVAPHFIMI